MAQTPPLKKKRKKRYHLNKPRNLAIYRTLLIPPNAPFAPTLVFYATLGPPDRDFGVPFRPSGPRTSRKHATLDLAGASDGPKNPFFVDPPPHDLLGTVAGSPPGTRFLEKSLPGPLFRPPIWAPGLDFPPRPGGRRIPWPQARGPANSAPGFFSSSTLLPTQEVLRNLKHNIT